MCWGRPLGRLSSSRGQATSKQSFEDTGICWGEQPRCVLLLGLVGNGYLDFGSEFKHYGFIKDYPTPL